MIYRRVNAKSRKGGFRNRGDIREIVHAPSTCVYLDVLSYYWWKDDVEVRIRIENVYLALNRHSKANIIPHWTIG